MRIHAMPDLRAVIRGARAAARMTQADLGMRCGYSRSVISRIETGQVTPGWVTVARLAGILDISPEALGLTRPGGDERTSSPGSNAATKVPLRQAANEEDAVRRRQLLALTGQAAVLAVGSALPAAASRAQQAGPQLSALEEALLYGPPPPAEHEPTPQGVTRVVAAARSDLAVGNYTQLAQTLPRSLALAESANSPAALAALYNVATRTAIKAGNDQLVATAADRALLAARATGDALLVAEAHRMVSAGYRRHGHHARAVEIATRAADQLVVDRTASQAAKLSPLGNLYATAAYTAAMAGDRPSAYELLGHARAMAQNLGPDQDAGGWFGPRQVALHEVSVHHQLGNPAAAVAAARSIDVRGLPRERAARLYTDLARAYASWGRPEGC